MTGTAPFDAVMLSYDEPLADALHARLAQVLGGTVKRLHGVCGMRRAYQLTAELADTELFFLADADFAIDPQFSAATVTPLADGVSMRVWRAVNPLNGLTYGYGGLKLIRRTALRELGEAVDVLAALPGRVEFIHQTAGVTQFNQSPYHAWKAGFREVAMLARGSEYGMSNQRTAERIAAWRGCSHGRFAADAAAGAAEAITFATDAARRPDEFDLLNDPDWLQQRFTSTHPERAITA